MRPNYRDREVRALVERYEELQGRKSTNGFGLRTLLTLVDIQRALKRVGLSPIEKQVLYLHGLAGYTTRATGELIGRDKVLVQRHYLRAIEKLTNYLNGGRSEHS